MNKIIGNIIAIAVIASVLAFAGCIGKESTTPTASPSPTSISKQVVSTPTPTPIVTPSLKERVNVTLKAGYKWYQNNNLSYRIGYPENWKINPYQSYQTAEFDSPSLTSPIGRPSVKLPEAVIDPTLPLTF